MISISQLLHQIVPIMNQLQLVQSSQQRGSRTSFDGTRSYLNQHLKQFRQYMLKHCSEPEVDDMQLALIALIDESVINSSWEYKEQWLQHSLQYEHYECDTLGEVFYERLAVQQTKLTQQVYLLCLCSGFAGKYGTDSAKRQALKHQLIEQIEANHAPANPQVLANRHLPLTLIAILLAGSLLGLSVFKQRVQTKVVRQLAQFDQRLDQRIRW